MINCYDIFKEDELIEINRNTKLDTYILNIILTLKYESEWMDKLNCVLQQMMFHFYTSKQLYINSDKMYDMRVTEPDEYITAHNKYRCEVNRCIWHASDNFLEWYFANALVQLKII
jgi:hypothetical protein